LVYKLEKPNEAVKFLCGRLVEVQHKADWQQSFASTAVCWAIKQCWYLLFRERQKVSYVPIIIGICAMITVDAEKNDW